MPTSALAYAASASLGANSRLLSVRAFTSAPAAATLAIVLRWNRRARRPRRATCETACWEIPVGRDDPGPPNVKFSADFLAYKNLRRGGYQPPGFCKHPRFGRIISAPTKVDIYHPRSAWRSGMHGWTAPALASASRKSAPHVPIAAAGRCGQSGPQAAFRRPTARRAALRPEIGPYGY